MEETKLKVMLKGSIPAVGEQLGRVEFEIAAEMTTETLMRLLTSLMHMSDFERRAMADARLYDKVKEEAMRRNGEPVSGEAL